MKRTYVGRYIMWVTALVVSIVFLVPTLWMVITSLKPSSGIFTLPPSFLPKHVVWSNYPDALSSAPFARYFINSVIVSVSAVLVSLSASAMAGYSLARLRYRGRELFFLLILATVMVPFQVTIVPLFILLRHFPLVGGNNIAGNGGLGLLDSYPGLILPYAASAFGIFIMRQFFLTLPTDLEDSARVEGASEFRVFWQIMLPLVKPAIATLSVFTFQAAWNGFLWPLVIVKHDYMNTLQLGLSVFQQQFTTQWNLLMAATVMATVPVMALFLVAQRTFTQGIALSGLKT